jgi:hypothetical protein
VRPLSDQWIQAAFRAPGQVAAEVRFGVRAGGALETSQVGSYCQSQPVGERLRKIAGRWGQLGEGHQSLTLRCLPATVKLPGTRLAAKSEPLEDVAGGIGELGPEGEALAVDLDGR